METFIVRIWVPDDAPDGQPELNGLIEQVRTREVSSFVDDGQLLELLRVARDGAGPGHDTRGG